MTMAQASAAVTFANYKLMLSGSSQFDTAGI